MDTQLTIRHYQKVTMALADTRFDCRSIPDTASESFWHAADGWPIRRIDWRARGAQRGSMLFLPGRGDHYEKYLETLNFFAKEGWLVTAIDWRGQGGSGRILADSHIGHIEDFSIWIADLTYFWTQWKNSTPGPHVLVAHSMGGHLAIRALAEKTIDPDSVALSAPMLGIQRSGLPVALHHSLARFLRSLGNPKRAAWKEGEKPMSPLNIRSKILTHDADRYADEIFWWHARPHIKLGPPSWHWVERAIASTRLLAKKGVMESIETPTLLMATMEDRLVDTRRIIQDAKRLKKSELLLFAKDAAHELLREADPVRDRCLSAITQFFDRHAAQQ
jgi:lysophospholipase